MNKYKEKTNKILNKIIEILYISGLFIMIFLANVMVLTGITFILKGTISYIQLPLSFIVTIIELYIFKIRKLKKLLLSIILAFLIIISSSYICSKYYDVNWDSNTYHKDAVGALANGWNPIYEDYISFYKKSGYRDMNIIGKEITKSHGFWQTYYAKGIWNISANMYYYTGNIESSKIVNILLVYVTFTFVLYLLNTYTKNIFLPIIVAFIFSVSPISLTQMFSYYNDGALYNALLITIISFILFIINKKIKQTNEIYLWITSSIIVVSNIKFTGFAYAGCFCLALYIYYIIYQFKNNKIKEIIKPTVIFAISVIAAIFIAGFQPYITNTYLKGNPFYPLMGKNKVDIVTYNEPSEFHNYSTIKKFSYSLFGKTININENSPIPVQLKQPFMIYTEEIVNLRESDTRIAGFGLLFSGIFIISVFIIIFGLYKNYKENKIVCNICFSLTVVIIFLILFISESWWARYTPFVYYIPLMAIIILICRNKNIEHNNNYLTILLTIMILNINFFITHNLIYNFEQGREMRKKLNELEYNKEQIVVVDTYNSFMGYLYNLDDRNIIYDYTTKSSKQDLILFEYLKYRK